MTDLAAYLDWPLDFSSGTNVWCAAQGCPRCEASDGHPPRICHREGLTPRVLLEAVKAHAEGRPQP